MIGKYECYARQLEKLAFVFNYNSELRTKDEWEKTIQNVSWINLRYLMSVMLIFGLK